AHAQLSHALYFSLSISLVCSLPFFFFNDPATPEIYTLSLHDALPIWAHALGRRLDLSRRPRHLGQWRQGLHPEGAWIRAARGDRSEEHTSELQSLTNLVCRLLLEKKKKNNTLCTRQLTLSLKLT